MQWWCLCCSAGGTNVSRMKLLCVFLPLGQQRFFIGKEGPYLQKVSGFRGSSIPPRDMRGKTYTAGVSICSPDLITADLSPPWPLRSSFLTLFCFSFCLRFLFLPKLFCMCFSRLLAATFFSWFSLLFGLDVWSMVSIASCLGHHSIFQRLWPGLLLWNSRPLPTLYNFFCDFFYCNDLVWLRSFLQLTMALVSTTLLVFVFFALYFLKFFGFLFFLAGLRFYVWNSYFLFSVGLHWGFCGGAETLVSARGLDVCPGIYTWVLLSLLPAVLSWSVVMYFLVSFRFWSYCLLVSWRRRRSTVGLTPWWYVCVVPRTDL